MPGSKGPESDGEDNISEELLLMSSDLYTETVCISET